MEVLCGDRGDGFTRTEVNFFFFIIISLRNLWLLFSCEPALVSLRFTEADTVEVKVISKI